MEEVVVGEGVRKTVVKPGSGPRGTPPHGSTVYGSSSPSLPPAATHLFLISKSSAPAVDFVGRLAGDGVLGDAGSTVFDSTAERGHFFTFTIGQGTFYCRCPTAA